MLPAQPPSWIPQCCLKTGGKSEQKQNLHADSQHISPMFATAYPICTKHVLSGKEWGEVRCQTLTIYTGFLFEIITTSTEKSANVDMCEHPNDLNLDFEIKTTL